jgi:isoaspartyl peptidase/L-asparaginase-like protein (Ntn-hydrolase superfamily)
MANRHAHKKLRADIRASMAATGESYQQAHARVATRRLSATGPQVDLVAVSYYGIPLALATIEMHGMSIAVLVPSSRWWRDGYPAQSPVPLMQAAMRSRGAA